MFQTIYVGKLFGIKVYIHWTFWLLAIYVAMANLNKGFFGMLSALGFVFAIFGCVFLHEMGHALAAKWFRVPTLDITLLPIGGVARMGELTRSPAVELVVALAGPMVNVAIALMLMLGISIGASYAQVSAKGIDSIGPWEQLLLANVALALFNMLPSFPMDGGRVLRSLLAMIMPYSLATVYTSRVGQVMAVLMFFASIYFGQLSLTIIAIMVFVVCTGELLKERFKQMASQMSTGFQGFQQSYPQPFEHPFEQPGESVPSQDDIVDAVEVRQVR